LEKSAENKRIFSSHTAPKVERGERPRSLPSKGKKGEEKWKVPSKEREREKKRASAKRIAVL